MQNAWSLILTFCQIIDIHIIRNDDMLVIDDQQLQGYFSSNRFLTIQNNAEKIFVNERAEQLKKSSLTKDPTKAQFFSSSVNL